jgi:hypothetical protein
MQILDDGKSHPVIVIRNRLFDWNRTPFEMLQWQAYPRIRHVCSPV